MQKTSGLFIRTKSTRIKKQQLLHILQQLKLKAAKDTVKLALTIVACVLLYKLSHDIATAQRGYEAIGGEPVFAMLPLVVYYVRKRR